MQLKKESKMEFRDVCFSATVVDPKILVSGNLSVSRDFPVEDQPSVVGHHHGVGAPTPMTFPGSWTFTGFPASCHVMNFLVLETQPGGGGGDSVRRVGASQRLLMNDHIGLSSFTEQNVL